MPFADIPLDRLWQAVQEEDNEKRGEQIGALAVVYNVELGSLRRYVNQRRRALAEAASLGILTQREPQTAGDFESQWRTYSEWIGRAPDRPIPDPTQRKDDDHVIVGVLADLHGDPNPDVINALLDNEAPDWVIIAGDIFDYYAYSQWSKDKHIEPEAEQARIQALVELLIPVTERIIICRGNHDRRREHYFARRVDPWAMGEIKASPLSMLGAQFDSVEVVSNRWGFTTPGGQHYEEQFNDQFMVAIGDAVIGHPEYARKGEGRSIAAFVEGFDRWRVALGIAPPALLAMGHCHRAAVTYPNAGHRAQVELPIAAHPRVVQYQFERGRLDAPPVLGYFVFEMKRKDGAWSTVLNSERIYRA